LRRRGIGDSFQRNTRKILSDARDRKTAGATTGDFGHAGQIVQPIQDNAPKS
jgi:hypothetical protein